MKTLYYFIIAIFALQAISLQSVHAQEWKSITTSVPPATLTQSVQNFDIQYSVVNGTGSLQENNYMFTANVQSNTSGTFEIKIPRIFPYYNGKDGPSDTETYVIIKDGVQLKSSQYNKNVSDCSYDYTVPFNQRSTIIVTSTDALLLMTPIYGDKVTSDCTSGAMTSSQVSAIKTLCSQSFDHGPTFGEIIGEEQCENPMQQINYNGVNLTVTSAINKTTFKAGENITIVPKFTSVGNHNVTIGYCGQLFTTLTVDQFGKIMWPQYAWTCPLFEHAMTLEPNTPTTGESYGQNIVLYTPGNYTIESIASFGYMSKTVVLWSKPVQITILSEKIPEFSFAVLVLLIGTTSFVLLYRLKFGLGRE